jgi:hypothetical protein
MPTPMAVSLPVSTRESPSPVEEESGVVDVAVRQVGSAVVEVVELVEVLLVLDVLEVDELLVLDVLELDVLEVDELDVLVGNVELVELDEVEEDEVEEVVAAETVTGLETSARVPSVTVTVGVPAAANVSWNACTPASVGVKV